MDEIVYFGDELQKRAPGAVGQLYFGGTPEWITADDVIEAVKRKIPVCIRPATESEMKRAEALAALYEIGQQIGQRVGQLLDQETPEDIQKAKARMAQTLFAANTPANLLDKVQAGEGS